jgi:hypothetical protein
MILLERYLNEENIFIAIRPICSSPCSTKFKNEWSYIFTTAIRLHGVDKGTLIL